MSKQSDKSSFDYELNSDDPSKGLWVVIGIIALIIGAFVFLRTEPSNIGNADELALTLTDGRPKVIEFYSNFWTTCLLNKPIVDGLERDLTGKAEVVRLDVTTQVGQRAAAKYGVRGTPTVIVIDGQGQPILTQLALVRPSPIKEQIDMLLAQAN